MNWYFTIIFDSYKIRSAAKRTRRTICTDNEFVTPCFKAQFKSSMILSAWLSALIGLYRKWRSASTSQSVTQIALKAIYKCAIPCISRLLVRSLAQNSKLAINENGPMHLDNLLSFLNGNYISSLPPTLHVNTHTLSSALIVSVS